MAGNEPPAIAMFETFSQVVRRAVDVAKRTAAEVAADDVLTLAAALSFYTALSLSPVLLLTLWLARNLGFDDQSILVQKVGELIGQEASTVIAVVLENARETPSLGSLAGALGFGALLLSAAGVFGQLQLSFNRIWNVAPPSRTSWLMWARKRLLSFGMVFSLGFVAVVSMVVSAALSFVTTRIGFGALGDVAPTVSDTLLSVIVFAAFFSALFKLLPDTKLEWREVWFGGIVTALLFTAGKGAIGLYLGRSSLGSAYGAAGSIVVLLAWVYYSSLILFVGAELTQVCSKEEPNRPVESELEAGSDRRSTPV